MNMVNDLKIIKKKYGERMMNFCRSSFSTILDVPGLLSSIFINKFYPSFDLYNDLVSNNKLEEFKDFIYTLSDLKSPECNVDTNLTPKDIFNNLGYDFYECHTDEEVQYFKKYYAPYERLCTFEGDRLSRCHIFWVVKRNALELNRDEFLYPAREDEYGTSVMSIQFEKSENNRLSIKNRYNDTINNPDATYNNNLENIYRGLTKSFYNTYGLLSKNSSNTSFDLPDYVYACNKKYYKYNYCYNEIYYTTDNIIIDNNEIKEFAKEKYIIFDYYVLDLVNKTLSCYDKSVDDSLPLVIGEIKSINIYNDKENMCKKIYITNEKEEKYLFTLSRENKLIKIENNTCKMLPDKFLIMNKYLKELEFDNLSDIGNQVLYSNKDLEYLHGNNIINIGEEFLRNNENLTLLLLPNCENIKSNFLSSNRIINNLYIPKVKYIGNNFLFSNLFINQLEMNNVRVIGNNFLYNNDMIKSINMDTLIKVGNFFMYNNKKIEEIHMDNVEFIGNNFLMNNRNIEFISLPNVQFIDKYFMSMNEEITNAYIPMVESIGDYFLYKNKVIKEITINRDVIYNKINKNIISLLENIKLNNEKNKVR